MGEAWLGVEGRALDPWAESEERVCLVGWLVVVLGRSGVEAIEETRLMLTCLEAYRLRSSLYGGVR